MLTKQNQLCKALVLILLQVSIRLEINSFSLTCPLSLGSFLSPVCSRVEILFCGVLSQETQSDRFLQNVWGQICTQAVRSQHFCQPTAAPANIDIEKLTLIFEMSKITEMITKRQQEVALIKILQRSTTNDLCNSTVTVIHVACLSALIVLNMMFGFCRCCFEHAEFDIYRLFKIRYSKLASRNYKTRQQEILPCICN